MPRKMELEPTAKRVDKSADLASGMHQAGRATGESSSSSDTIVAQSPYKVSLIRGKPCQDIIRGQAPGSSHLSDLSDRATLANAVLPGSPVTQTATDKPIGSNAALAATGSGKDASKATMIPINRWDSGERTREQHPNGRKIGRQTGNWKFFDASVNQKLKANEVVEKLASGQLLVVNSRRRNGLIVLRKFHAEFAGPGAAVGGDLDTDIVEVIPIGNLSLLPPDSHQAHQNAIKIRLQWIRLTQNFTDQASPDDRARMILEQFKTYFDQATVDRVPDEAFAMLVGVLPQTIHRVRSGFVWS